VSRIGNGKKCKTGSNMKFISVSFLACALAGADVDVETFVFGLSHHTNRSVDWNERNYGLGLGLAYHVNKYSDITVFTGTYNDSFNDQAKFASVGLRGIIGDRNALHATFGLSGGYLNGSNVNGFVIMPVMSLGYDWIDICVTGQPNKSSGNNSGSSDPRDNRNEQSSTGVYAGFIKFRIATF